MARRRDGVDAARRAEGATGGASTRTGKIHHPWFRMRSCRDFGASTKRAMWLAMAGFSASRRVWAEPFENRTGLRGPTFLASIRVCTQCILLVSIDFQGTHAFSLKEILFRTLSDEDGHTRVFVAGTRTPACVHPRPSVRFLHTIMKKLLRRRPYHRLSTAPCTRPTRCALA